MAVVVSSTNGLDNVAVTYKDITGKKQTVHYLLNTSGDATIDDGLFSTILNDIDQMTNAQISRFARTSLPVVTGLKTAPTNAASSGTGLSMPYVKNYVVYTFIGGTRNEAGNLVDYPVVIPAPNNLSIATTGALIATPAGYVTELEAQFTNAGAYPIGYASGQRSYHSGDLVLNQQRSGYEQLTATTINA